MKQQKRFWSLESSNPKAMANAQDLHIQWKTDAWKDPGTVVGYDRNVSALSGFNLMKNRVETELFERFMKGAKILDVGIGTGRASLPLARAGRRVTGVDSSQAMLDKCRELAEGTTISLQIGDVTSLPFSDASFDSVMSLNTFAHFPHWQAMLREWRRVVRAGGELMFDVYSLDHDIAFARATGQSDDFGVTHFAPQSVEGYYLRVAVEELVEFATQLGLRVRAIAPYSALFGRAGWNRFFQDSLIESNAWDRLLSWVSSDAKLFDFLAFLESEIVSKLTSQATCRFMAVFDVADASANRDWIDRNRRYNAELMKGLSPSTVAQFGGVDVERVRHKLSEFMIHQPCRFTLARLMLANRRWNWPLHLREWIEERYRLQLDHVYALGLVDDVVLGLVRSLSNSPQVSEILRYCGVPLTSAFEYDLMIAGLDEGFGAFAHSFSVES